MLAKSPTLKALNAVDARMEPKKAGPAAPQLARLMADWEALLARDEDLKRRREPLEDRADELLSPRLSNPALLYQDSDATLNLTCGIPKGREIGSDPAWYHGGYAKNLRCTPQRTISAQVRASEILAAWERREGEMLGIHRSLGLDLIEAEDNRLGEEMLAKRRQIMMAKASSITEIMFKAKVAFYCTGEESVAALCTVADDANAEGLAFSVVRDLLMMEGANV